MSRKKKSIFNSREPLKETYQKYCKKCNRSYPGYLNSCPFCRDKHE